MFTCIRSLLSCFLPTRQQRRIPSPPPKSISHSTLSLTNPYPPLRASDSKLDVEATILIPYNYIAGLPSKGVREHLIAAMSIWMHVPPDTLDIITNVITMLHTASLLIDDIEDNSPTRRGQPAAHIKYDPASTINSANYMYVRAIQEIQELPHAASRGVFLEEFANLHLGQGLDIHWRQNEDCPTEEEYLFMVAQKTGGMFRLIVRLMEEEAEGERIECAELATLLGKFFQVRDDYMNLKSSAYTATKGFCEDLSEGKFSLLMIHGIRAKPKNMLLREVVRRGSRGEEVSDEMKRRVLKYLDEETGSFEYTRRFLIQLLVEIRAECARIEKLTGRKNLILEEVIRRLEVV